MARSALHTLILLTLSLLGTSAQAGELNYPRYAQLETGDDAYDPFADYSEFEEASEEEADVNFFRNGRFFSIGGIFAHRAFTGSFPNQYGRSTPFGVFLTYFFDLRMAFQVSYITGEHPFTLNYSDSGTNITYAGKATINSLSFHLKYFINTQNVTKGLSAFNPYVIGGFSQNYRTLTLNGLSGAQRDGASSLDIGLGIEVPLSQHRWFIGVQGMYQVINLPDENTPIYAPNAAGTALVNTGIIPKGDLYMIGGLLGVNF